MRNSEQVLFRERDHFLPGDDQMIQNPDIHKRKRVLQPSRDEFIRLARLGDAARVVM